MRTAVIIKAMDNLKAYESVWDLLARETRPIVLYGMGDGADKILDVFAQRGIRAAAVFASDEFVRGHSFRGFPVERLRDVEARLGPELVIVLAFASQRPEVMARMYGLEARFTVYAPDVPVVGGTLFTSAFAREHADALREAYGLLADEQSRRVFRDTVAFKLSGRLRYLRGSETGKDEAFTQLLRPGAQEHFVDLGAYNGDTIRELLRYTGGRFASLTAFEPDPRNRKKLRRYADESLGGQVRIIPAGAWDNDGTLPFAARAGRSSALGKGGGETAVRSVDSVLGGAPCTLLKLDVEGAERRALLGARETLRRWKPSLNVAAYHRSEDLFELPLLVHALCPDYRLYLRHHPYVPAWDTNLYACAPAKRLEFSGADVYTENSSRKADIF